MSFPKILLQNPWVPVIVVLLPLGWMAMQPVRATDEAIWAYSSWLWAAHEDPPYVGSFENKPFGIFLLYRASQAIFGLSYLPVRVLSWAAVLGTMALLFGLGRRFQGATAGTMASLIFGLTMIHPMTDGSVRAFTETFLVFFSTLAFFLLDRVRWDDPIQRRRRWLLVGVGASLGAALGIKQIAVFDVAAMAPFYGFVVRRSHASPRAALTGIFWIGLGGCAVTALGLLPLLGSGVSLHDYWLRAWGILFSQSGQLSWLDRWELFWLAWGGSPLVIVAPLVLYFLARKKTLQKAGVPFWCLLAWLALDFVGGNAQNMFGHQIKQTMAPLALVAGLGFGSLIESMADRATWLGPAMFAAIVFLLFPYGDVVAGVESRRAGATPNLQRLVAQRDDRLARYLASRTDPSESVFIWDTWSHAIHVNAKRRSACRYFNTYLHFAPDFETTLVADLQKRRPRWIAVNRESVWPMPTGVQAILADRYAPVDRLDAFQIYRLRDESP